MIDNKKVIAITFARAGSKGVKQKNIKLLAGKPLLAYASISAQNCALVDDYFVSTDGELIAQTAVDCGAKLIKRPKKLATDKASEFHAWQHAVTDLVEQGIMALDDIFVSVPCTSPLRNSQDIVLAIEAFSQADSDLALGICEADRSPYFNMVSQENNGHVNLVCQSEGFTRRQDVPEVFNITTMVYVTTPRFILNHNSVMSGRTLGVLMDKDRSIDIDTELDFEIADFLIKRQQRNLDYSNTE